MREFIVLQEQSYDDEVAIYNAILCMRLGVYYYPYPYHESILLFEDLGRQFKYIVQIQKDMILESFQKEVLSMLPNKVYLSSEVTFVNTISQTPMQYRTTLPANLVVLRSWSCADIVENIKHNQTYYPDACLVVARYNESLNWLGAFDSRMLRVYNKGGIVPQTKLTAELSPICLPNVGREAHTYLDYIVSNYDNLPGRVVFTQASVNKNEGCITTPYCFMIQLMESCVGNMGISRNYVRYDEYYPTTYNMREKAPCTPCSSVETMVFGDWFEKYVEQPFEENPKWFKGAIMCISKEMILSRTKEYYQRLLGTVSSSKDPEEAYYLERSWYYIFQQPRLFYAFVLCSKHREALEDIAYMNESVSVFVVLDPYDQFYRMPSCVEQYASKIFRIEKHDYQELNHQDVIQLEIEKHFEPNNRDLIMISDVGYTPEKSKMNEILSAEIKHLNYLNSRCVIAPYSVLKAQRFKP